MNSKNSNAVKELCAKLLEIDRACPIAWIEEVRNGFDIYGVSYVYEDGTTEIDGVATILDDELPISSFTPFNLMSHAITKFQTLTATAVWLEKWRA